MIQMVEQNIFQNSSSTQSVPNQNQNKFVDVSNGAYSSEDYDYSDLVFKYINDMLMEEDMENNVGGVQESVALQEAEKSFYEALQVPDSNLGILDCEENYFVDESSYRSNTGIWCPNWFSDPVDVASTTNLQSPYNDGLMDSPESTLNCSDVFSDCQSVMQCQTGVQVSRKFLPDNRKDFDSRIVSVMVEKSDSYDAKGKKNLHGDDDLEQGRSNKQSALYTESAVRSEIFDMVLLCSKGKNDSAVREALQKNANKSSLIDSQSKGSNGKKSRGKKQRGKRNVVDLRTLLMLCAQAVGADDYRTANDFLKQIRQHSSPTGDGMQRLAHYFADGLEGRMAGTGTQIHRDLISFPVSASDTLKAYQLYLATCPFRKLSIFFSNKTILKAAENAPRLHIVDFGILYGFQWPSLIQQLSSRPGGPPKLRITGIDLPHPGFRPSQRVEETGDRLSCYAETFKVPFEFHAIAQKWETIKLEDLDIRDDEVLIVNCLYRLRNLLDETVVINSPRNSVLNLIRQMNPHTFILGTVNGAYNAPFFITRFREALFHYSSLFDMLDASIPREIHERMLLEKVFFAKEAMNVIACEGVERVERPETYKQWQIRNQRLGFKQLPLNEEIMNIAKERVKAYHKDFVIDKDSRWLLQGWKGRIVYALSSWRR